MLLDLYAKEVRQSFKLVSMMHYMLGLNTPNVFDFVDSLSKENVNIREMMVASKTKIGNNFAVSVRKDGTLKQSPAELAQLVNQINLHFKTAMSQLGVETSLNEEFLQENLKKSKFTINGMLKDSKTSTLGAALSNDYNFISKLISEGQDALVTYLGFSQVEAPTPIIPVMPLMTVTHQAPYVVPLKVELLSKLSKMQETPNLLEINKTRDIEIHCDADNINYFNFYTIVDGLDKVIGKEKGRKAVKLFIYMDAKTNGIWGYMPFKNVKVERIDVPRIKDNKSVVDTAIAVEVAMRDIDDTLMVIASSDSDYIELIKRKRHDYIVMFEPSCVNTDYLSELLNLNVPHLDISGVDVRPVIEENRDALIKYLVVTKLYAVAAKFLNLDTLTGTVLNSITRETTQEVVEESYLREMITQIFKAGVTLTYKVSDSDIVFVEEI